MSTTEPTPDQVPTCAVCGSDAPGQDYFTATGEPLCSAVCGETLRGRVPPQSHHE
jgi:hypothetical protein